MIGPCVEVLRQLTKIFNNALGADQGTRHAPPDLSNDIETLMDSLEEYKVYRIQAGRILDEDDLLVPDAASTGFHSLSNSDGPSNPLDDYNTAFQRLQHRRRMKPLVPRSQRPSMISSNPVIPTAPDETQHPTMQASLSNPPSEPQPLLPTCVSEPANSNQEDHVTLQEEEEPTEVMQILEDLENGIVDPTLPRLGEEDVAWDMDMNLLEDLGDSESDSESSSDEDIDPREEL
jgi:hypothetical protein